ncbi:MAG: amino acid deaminase [Actinophytocola sp.]|uniref:amino acid deaminase n=1 Tax=Actinophytocola sp. TaxID=1872138 RepID=UPI001321A330|nr:amino acid deaminase [Actinophytocola sp.]MPZ79902.1 amino acid deaminase [Actinophytocola sp.]
MVQAGRIDREAVAAILEERVDWRFKGMPARASGMSIAEARAAGLSLFRDGFLPPVVVLDAEALEHNLTAMAHWCAGHGFAHAPHGKTTMAPQLYAKQFDHGAWGQTAANASQLRVCRAFGVSPVMLANELVDPAALAWLATELDRDPAFEFSCWVDSVRGVALMTEALRGATRPVDVLVEVGIPDGRSGVRDRAAALEVAEAVVASPALRLVGVGGYEGSVSSESSPDALGAVAGYLAGLRALTLDLAERGHLDGVERVLVTAGGSAYFDQVAEVFGEPWPAGLPVLPVLRSGAYVTHDSGFYDRLSPLGAHPRITGAPPLRPALRAWAQVTSHPEPGLALLTAGKRDMPYDIDLPIPQLLRRDGAVQPVGGKVTALNDQHAFLRYDTPVEVGDWVGLGLSHPCTTFDKWPLLPVTGQDGETVVDLIRTYF